MKKLLAKMALTFGALMLLALTSSAAYADGIVFIGTDTTHPDGVGLRTVLSIQSPGNTSTESGGVAYTGSGDTTFGNATRGGTNNTVRLGDIASPTNTALRINLNINEPSGGPGSDPIHVDSLILRAYNSSGQVVFQANLLQSQVLSLIGNGQGTADYVFGLDADAAARLAAIYNADLRIGLEATITHAQGGPESFFLGIGPANPKPVPEPATMFLLGSGLAGIAASARKRRKANKE